MADTTTAANNKSVKFSGRMEREMSSYNNRGISHSNGSKDNPVGITNAAPIKKMGKATRKKAKKAIARGMISEKAAKRHFGNS